MDGRIPINQVGWIVLDPGSGNRASTLTGIDEPALLPSGRGESLPLHAAGTTSGWSQPAMHLVQRCHGLTDLADDPSEQSVLRQRFGVCAAPGEARFKWGFSSHVLHQLLALVSA